MNVLPIEKRVQVIAALVEGSSINSIVRMTGVAKHTILKLLEDVGCACAAYHHVHFISRRRTRYRMGNRLRIRHQGTGGWSPTDHHGCAQALHGRN
jgi:hypothetical protein